MVEVTDGHDHPVLAVLVLRTAIDRPGGMFGVLEIQRLPTDLMNAAIERLENGFGGVEGLKRLAPPAPAAAVDILGEQLGQGIQIPSVDRQGVTCGQLADGELRLDPLQAGQQCVLAHGFHEASPCQTAVYRPPSTWMICPVT
ncbi:hypothetical protein D3C75_1111170 [compost metagenome]